MNVWIRPRARRRDGPGGAIDVARRTAGQRRDDRPLERERDASYGLGIGLRRDRKAGLEMSTPSASIWRASRTFSSIRSENPGACSPSRSVVSKTISRSAWAASVWPQGRTKVKVMIT